MLDAGLARGSDEGKATRGDGTAFVAEPMGEGGQPLPAQAGDIAMGVPQPEPPSSSPMVTEDISGYPSASSGSLEGQSAETPPLQPPKTESMFSQPSTSTQMVRFKKKVPASVELQHNLEQRCYIHQFEGPACTDLAAQHLI